jgi:hypothetical protein
MRQFALLTFLIVGVSCRTATDPVNADVLDVRVASADLVLTNQSQWPVAVFVSERNALMISSFLPCTGPTECRHEPGSTWKQPLAMVPGYAPGREIVISWRVIAPSVFGRQDAGWTGTQSIRP